MKKIRHGLSLAVWLTAVNLHGAVDGLPSWNDGPVKQSILTFVGDVTTPGTALFVAPSERIAVFDNDGTLWTEQPSYTQFVFAMDRVKAVAARHRNGPRKMPSNPPWPGT